MGDKKAKTIYAKFGRKRVLEKFTNKKISEEILKIYEGLLAGLWNEFTLLNFYLDVMNDILWKGVWWPEAQDSWAPG